jgi:hypothetical protein
LLESGWLRPVPVLGSVEEDVRFGQEIGLRKESNVVQLTNEL